MKAARARALASKPAPDRTVCGCGPCAAHCRRQPGALGPGDYEALSEFIGLSGEALDEMLVASPGALYIEDGDLFQIGGVVPARAADGSCTWLTPEGMCAVHPVAPMGCRLFDSHMDEDESERRSLWLNAVSQLDAAFWAMRERLVQAGRVEHGAASFERYERSAAELREKFSEAKMAAACGDFGKALRLSFEVAAIVHGLRGV